MYIRTKDGIYEIDKNTKGTEDFLWVKTNKANIVQCVWLNCIINQSENLDELCDKFVYCQNGFYEMYSELDFAHYDKEYIKNGGTIKGAIWTSKGLIYVAKMNDDGKLVLI